MDFLQQTDKMQLFVNTQTNKGHSSQVKMSEQQNHYMYIQIAHFDSKKTAILGQCRKTWRRQSDSDSLHIYCNSSNVQKEESLRWHYEMTLVIYTLSRDATVSLHWTMLFHAMLGLCYSFVCSSVYSVISKGQAWK